MNSNYFVLVAIAVYRGISTYEYVVQLREKAEKDAREKQMEDGKIELANSKSSKVCSIGGNKTQCIFIL